MALLIAALVAVGCVPVEEAAEEILPIEEETPAPEQVTAVPTLTAPARPEAEPTLPQPTTGTPTRADVLAAQVGALQSLYNQVNPGVVSIQVIVERMGMTGAGAGSGFILDDQGHIITNDHVVAQAENIIVVFYDGFQAKAEVIGTDPDSDLAVLKADSLTEGAHLLQLADSDEVQPGDVSIAIVNLYIAQANDLESQQGAYIHQVIEDGPAAKAGLQGSTGTTEIDGIEWPVGGDIVVETDGEPIVDFADLLVSVAFKRPGDTMDLTIIRDGERQQVTVELEARPEDFEQSQ